VLVHRRHQLFPIIEDTLRTGKDEGESSRPGAVLSIGLGLEKLSHQDKSLYLQATPEYRLQQYLNETDRSDPSRNPFIASTAECWLILSVHNIDNIVRNCKSASMPASRRCTDFVSWVMLSFSRNRERKCGFQGQVIVRVPMQIVYVLVGESSY